MATICNGYTSKIEQIAQLTESDEELSIETHSNPCRHS
jgi:hypothetical protein